jgi:hypothetical protein
MSLAPPRSMPDTLSVRYSQLRFHVDGDAGRARHFLSGTAEYLVDPWVFDLAATQTFTTCSRRQVMGRHC